MAPVMIKQPLPFNPHRPPILYPLLPDCYFVLSAIRLRMSFLLLFKHLHALEHVAFGRLQVIFSRFSIDYLLEQLSLWMIYSLCLLFRKPPDRFFSMHGFIIETNLKRPRLVRWVLLSLLLAFGILQASLVVPPDSNSAPSFDAAPEHAACTAAFVAEHDEVTSCPREMGSWDSDGFPIVLDSGTSKSITPVYSDLINPRPFQSRLQGVGQGDITHVGAVSYSILDDQGRIVTLTDEECYFCSTAPYRLFCPHSWKKQMNAAAAVTGSSEGAGATFMTDPSSDGAYILSWDHGRVSVTAYLDDRVNLPILYATATYQTFSTFSCAFRTLPDMIPDGDQDLMPETMPLQWIDDKPLNPCDESVPHSRKVTFAPDVMFRPGKVYPREHAVSPTNISDVPPSSHDDALFLSWHIKLGHAPFKHIRWGARQGLFPKHLANCRNVVCPACLYGKQKRRPWRHKGGTSASHAIKKATFPGQFVSCDQLHSGTPGLVAQVTGRLTKSRYWYATVFVDHFSGLDYVHLQESSSAEDTIIAKQAFERFSKERGVTIHHYHCDNGVFASRAFRAEVERSGQTITFCGVGAHHQNGVAERRIQDLSDSARAMLAHASHRNPAITAHLWPYALRHASYVRRMLPREGHSMSPEEFFCNTSIRPTTKHLHCFGCPVYVLKDALQGGGPHPKWDDRSRVGIYLGHSAQHSPTVSLVMNPQTGYVSPQFHCVYDDQFDTAGRDKNFSKTWAEKAGLVESSSNVDNDEAESFPEYRQTTVPSHLQAPFSVPDLSTAESYVDNGHVAEQEPVFPDSNDDDNEDEPPIQEPEGATIDEPVTVHPTTRSGRRVKLTTRLQESELLPKLQSFVGIVHHVVAVLAKLDDNSLNELCRLVSFPASLADNDTMYLTQALKQEDKDKFLEAMVQEIHDHTSRGHWRITTKDEMRKRGYEHRPIMAIWSFKRKRNPFGQITKYKARLCCHGGQTIKGVHYEDTFSPVVAWSTVRFMLTLSEVYNWHARQIDFVLAFPQADVKTDIYMNVPEKFRVDNGKLVLDEQAPHPAKQGNVLKLIKNIYGLADASLTWHMHLKKGLLDFGFQQSQVDPCLFFKGNLLFVLYVDDGVVLTPNKAEADALIADLKQRGYILTDEGSLAAYLGLQIDRLPGNRISLKQPAFIDRIIKQCNLKDQRMHDTPADVILHRDEHGPERKNEFHMRSIVGQLNYLAATSRPDIQFAVHQCARFVAEPKMSHEKAIKRIIRYLKRTRDKGMIMHVDKSKGIECFVDADFAGGFRKEEPTNPRDCLSRTGYVIKFAGCPIVWSSKLQTTIALSTTEAEYMALSMACREVIYLINLTDELRAQGVDLVASQPQITCQIFEDNVGAIELAKLPKLRPRTKHLAIQYHHFRSWTVKGLNGEDPKIKINYISTELQEADIMTKPLAKQQFESLRKRLCGW